MSTLRLVDEREAAGGLSRAELEQLPIRNARRHYTQVIEVAARAASELRHAIAQEPIARGPLTRLIESHAWAQKTLYLAAQAVCDMEELTDDGAAEGITWEMKL